MRNLFLFIIFAGIAIATIISQSGKQSALAQSLEKVKIMLGWF